MRDHAVIINVSTKNFSSPATDDGVYEGGYLHWGGRLRTHLGMDVVANRRQGSMYSILRFAVTSTARIAKRLAQFEMRPSPPDVRPAAGDFKAKITDDSRPGRAQRPRT
jgi:hypothetical protein